MYGKEEVATPHLNLWKIPSLAHHTYTYAKPLPLYPWFAMDTHIPSLHTRYFSVQLKFPI